MGLPIAKLHRPAPLRIPPRVPKMIGVQPSSKFGAMVGARPYVPPAFSGTDTPVCALPFTGPAISSRALVPPASAAPASRLEGPDDLYRKTPLAGLKSSLPDRLRSASAEIPNSQLGRFRLYVSHTKQSTIAFSNSQLLPLFCKKLSFGLQLKRNAMIQNDFHSFSLRFQPPELHGES